jgi:hypothetical protein
VFSLHESVITKRQLNDKVATGCKGAVVMVYASVPIEYEVEFFDEDGDTLDVLTVAEQDLEKML